jgi:hypothetical protein
MPVGDRRRITRGLSGPTALTASKMRPFPSEGRGKSFPTCVKISANARSTFLMRVEILREIKVGATAT